MPATYLDIIIKKRDGHTLAAQDIERLVEGVTAHEIPDHQIGALLMAIYLRGLSIEETAALTMAMVRSGGSVNLSSIAGFKADKHSTGGVGDKVTLILGPLVAAAGVKFPKLSGRGLAHTGGTLDKLESIPGTRVDLTLEEFIHQVDSIGLAVTGQTSELVPADGIIYGLRDQTGTVDSMPLIASSVMCKKIAAGADGIVLDVKCGAGAFMKTLEDARQLARQMVDLGHAAGKETRALVTSMDQPLGFAVGNALEVAESIEVLNGGGPEDLIDEVLALGAEILVMARESKDAESARVSLADKLHDGMAAVKLREMVSWQGGNPDVVDDVSLLPAAERIVSVRAEAEGFVQSVNALDIGTIAMDLGAGRRSKSDTIAPSAGVVLRSKPGTGKVKKGDVIAELHVPPDWDARVSLDVLESRTRAALSLGPEPPETHSSVLARIS